MNGLYLYCIREKTEDASGFSTRSIDGKRDVFTIIHRELEAVVSRVSLLRFTSEEIQKKALEDLNWIKEKVVIHEDVIEEAMRGTDGLVDVIPMRFGIIFKNKTGLEEILNRDYEKMKRVLNKIRGKQEWSVKIYLTDSERFELAVKEKSEKIQLKEKEMISMPDGMAYFMEEELKETVCNEVNKELDTMLDKLFGKLGEEAAESVKTRILDREMTGKTERMVLNAAFLINTDKVDSFKKTLVNIDEDLKAKGINLEYSGPWPPFNFTNGGEKAC
ncbi:MAG: GvpL/GvpF family gas vesicle protein [Syntrophorhabdaceae bacterium]|nr:GvpL/GvpF family gas vesicle protein [Syntrophorhabdaceae bacterium]